MQTQKRSECISAGVETEWGFMLEKENKSQKSINTAIIEASMPIFISDIALTALQWAGNEHTECEGRKTERKKKRCEFCEKGRSPSLEVVHKSRLPRTVAR